MRATESPAPVSPLAPLRDARFRVAWFAFLAAQLVIWAQTVGAVDVITRESGSAALVALLQTAINLPGVVLSLLAGAVADVVDRRRLLVAAGVAMAASMTVLAVLTGTGAITPALVLVLTVALGAGLAMFLPAFSATVPDLVPRRLLAPAVAITNVSVNMARAVGPALAGVVIAVAGAGGLFGVLAGVLGVVVVLLALYAPRDTAPERPERIAAAVRAGARYARFSAPLLTVIGRTALFVLFGSALWAMLPVVTVRRLDLDASAFGILMGCIGGGAVAGAAVLPRVEARLGYNGVAAAGSVVLAGVVAALATVTAPLPAAAVMVVAGVAWMAVVTSLLTAAQLVAPAWVRGRAVAAWLLAFQLGFAVGGVLWGLVADASLNAALLVPAAGLLLTVLLGTILALPTGEGPAPEPAGNWDDPVVAAEPEDEDGPVLVIIEYEVAEEHHDAFVAAMLDLSTIRRRDGAVRWELYEDVARPGIFVETFSTATWGEHMRQHERTTEVDVPVEERPFAVTRSFTVRHLVGARGRRRGA
ncbi:MAG TPA: MFS transporter [Solirubrobacteraceae bacterium]|nr:MFS transporter [Solirubrobacteraceae bacterium]